MTQAGHPYPKHWAIVIFACRESAELLAKTLSAALIAAPSTAVVDVMINGNPELANQFAAQLDRLVPMAKDRFVRVWTIEQGDKANVWNQYMQQVWAGEEIAFFVDGYVRLNPNAVSLLGDEVTRRADVLGGTGLPSMGRSGLALRESMLKSGGFHGNFCCIKGEVIGQFKQRQITLPFGLYRVDSLMGALLSFELHPEQRNWNHKRIFAHPSASWQTDPKHWWRVSDIKAKLKQIQRQSRGILENLAVKDHFVARRQSPETLPDTASKLVLGWASSHADQVRAMACRNPFVMSALAHARQSNGAATGGLMPKLIKTTQMP